MKLVFVHIKGSKKGNTDILSKDKIVIGTDPSCDLCFEKEFNAIADFQADITVDKNGIVCIKAKENSTGLFVNKKLIETANLTDGDIISFDKNGQCEFCVRIINPTKNRMVLDFFLYLFQVAGVSSETLEKIKKSEKFQNTNALQLLIISTILIVVGVCFTFFYSNINQLKDTTRRVHTLEVQQSTIEDAIEKYRKGVCFIQGSYYIVDAVTDKPIRTDYQGKPFLSNYTGSGFMVDKKGYIMTNRHIAQPGWTIVGDPYKKQTPSHPAGLKVKFATLRAFFPDVRNPYPLKVVKTSKKADVAIMKFTPDHHKLPIFKFCLSDKDKRIGEPVILLGYPAGINAIFGKSNQDVVDELINLPVLKIAEELSVRKLIRPLITQGHIVDVSFDKIIYDAHTTFGGSGGPLIDKNGEVIGLNFGILKAFKGSNFAVPIKYGVNLMDELVGNGL